MAATERTGLMGCVDESGNLNILYPVTTADAVDGLSEFVEGYAPVSYNAQTLTDTQKAQARENIGVLEPLIGYTSDVTPAQVAEALQEGRDTFLVYVDPVYGPIGFTGGVIVPALEVVASSGIQPYGSATMYFSLIGSISMGSWIFSYDPIAKSSDIPTALPNPYALTFTGAFTGTYDGHAPLNVTIPTVPTALKNPNALTFTGAVTGTYDGSQALEINIPIAEEEGGDELIGETPVRLESEVTALKLVCEGSCSYTIVSDTVSDMEHAVSITPNNATFTQYDGYVEVKSTGGSGWFQSYADIVLGGLIVGESYNFIVDSVGHAWNETEYVLNGKYIVYDANNATLATATMDVVNNTVAAFNFTATTETVKVRAYPGDYNFTAGKSIARFNSVYINRADTSTLHTDIINKTGTFSGSKVIAGQSAGVTITSEPVCYVYSTGSDSDGSVAKSRHDGKLCVCFGDSITGNMAAPYDYPSIIAEETGMVVVNAGFGGCRMSDTHQTQAYAAFSMVKLAEAVASGDWTLQDNNVGDLSDVTNGVDHLTALKQVDWNDVDFVTIAYGTNDIVNYITFDNQSNLQDTKTFLGALRYAITTILTAYPHIKILLLTPLYRYWNEEGVDSDSKTFGDKSYPEWIDGILTVGEEYKIPAVDMYRTLGFNAITRTHYFQADGVHPNAKGLKVIGGKVSGRLLAEY